MDKQKMLSDLRGAKEIFVAMSLCTKMPYVVCDPETFDDEVLIYFSEEDMKREGKRLIEKKIPIQIAKVEAAQMLNFYANLYTMGVNCVLVNQYLDSETRIQLSELVHRPGNGKTPDGQVWIENPGLHLTALYFMQELRRQKLDALTDELKELQEEILADYSKGQYIAAFHENNGIPLLKQQNGDAYQPIFTDALEFRKFNKDNQFKAVVVAATKIPEVLAGEAKGVVVNPFGVNLQLPIVKRAAKKPEGQAAEGKPEEKPAEAAGEKAE